MKDILQSLTNVAQLVYLLVLFIHYVALIVIKFTKKE